MSSGIPPVRFPSDGSVDAPRSGLRLGQGPQGPVLLRLFRLGGTSLALVSTLAPAQLMAIRTAAAGTPVQVMTARPALWAPLRFDERLAQIYSPQDRVRPPDGPSLYIDDRPPQLRGPVESAPWQCRVDVRADWNRRDIASLAYADLSIFGLLPAEVTDVVASAFRVPRPLAANLARLEPGIVGVAQRGNLQFVRLDPTAAEAVLMTPEQSRGIAPARR